MNGHLYKTFVHKAASICIYDFSLFTYNLFFLPPLFTFTFQISTFCSLFLKKFKNCNFHQRNLVIKALTESFFVVSSGRIEDSLLCLNPYNTIKYILLTKHTTRSSFVTIKDENKMKIDGFLQ